MQSMHVFAYCSYHFLCNWACTSLTLLQSFCFPLRGCILFSSSNVPAALHWQSCSLLGFCCYWLMLCCHGVSVHTLLVTVLDDHYLWITEEFQDESKINLYLPVGCDPAGGNWLDIWDAGQLLYFCGRESSMIVNAAKLWGFGTC